MSYLEKQFNEEDIYYQKQSEFIKNILIWGLFFIIISIFTIGIGRLYSMVLEVVCIMIVMVLLMFITHSYNINPKPLLKIIRINTMIIISLYILRLVPVGNLNIVKSILIYNAENNIIYQESIYFFIAYYIISRSNKSKDIRIEYALILSVIITLNIVSNFGSHQNGIINSLYIVINEILVLVTIKNTIKDKLVVNRKINIFKFNIIFCFIFMNIRQIAKIFDWNSIYIITSIVNMIVFMVVLTAVINNITKSMYDFIFKDIHTINEKLNYINNEIILRNEELEKSEKEMEYKQNSYRKLLNSLPKAIVIINTENNRISYCNSDFKKLIGINDIRKILNRRIENIIEMDFNYKKINIKNTVEVYFGRTISNNKKNVEIRLSNYSESKREVTMAFEDITGKMKIESIKSELERKRINDDIKKNFLSNISHDFKIPVNVISSATQLENLLIKNNDIEGVKKYNAISKQNCLTLIKLTNNIIDISKISSEYVNPILTSGNIVEFVEELVVSLVEYAKLSKISIIFDTCEEELYMKYDRELMERIILNLVSNSIKFTPENGYINITINCNDKDIFISLEDSGVGMDEKFAKEAFNKYSMNLESVYANVQGTGVGLYVVYNLVNLQKGEIWIDSKVSKGAKFTMKFCKE